MKAHLAIVAMLLLTLIGPASAESASVRIGFKGGLNFSQVSSSPDIDEIDPGQLTGFGGGMEMGFAVSPRMDILADVLYLQKGASAHYRYRVGSKAGDQYREWDVDETLGYLVIAPTLRFSTQGQGLAPYVLAGGEIGILLDAKARQTASVADGGQELPAIDTKDQYKSNDFGLNFGAGFEIRSRSYSLFFEGRYALGLTNIAADTSTEGGTSETAKHRGVYVFGGLRF